MSSGVKQVDAPNGVWTKIVFRNIGNLTNVVDVINTGSADVEYSTDLDNPQVTGTISVGQAVVDVSGFIWVRGTDDNCEVSLKSEFTNPIIEATDITTLANTVANLTATVNGLVSDVSALQVSETTIGWDDLLGKFSTASFGPSAPVAVTQPNGVRALRFDNGNSLYIDYHTIHNGVTGSDVFAHIHMYTGTPMAAGETITWEASYVIARGYTQGDSILAARTTVNFTYTAPVGGVAAGDVIILEGAIPTFALPEPDATIAVEWKKTGGTFSGNVFGIQADLHYQTQRDNTPNRNFPFE